MHPGLDIFQGRKRDDDVDRGVAFETRLTGQLRLLCHCTVGIFEALDVTSNTVFELKEVILDVLDRRICA